MEKRIISLGETSYYFQDGKLFELENPDVEITPQHYAYTETRNGNHILILKDRAFLAEKDFQEISCFKFLKSKHGAYYRTADPIADNRCVFSLINNQPKVISRGFKEIIPKEIYLMGRQLYQIYDDELHFMQYCENLEVFSDRLLVYEGEIEISELTVYRKYAKQWKKVHQSVRMSHYRPQK